jgi:hypothetical protein
LTENALDNEGAHGDGRGQGGGSRELTDNQHPQRAALNGLDV